MGNLTLAINDELLKRARLRAVHEGTSVNEVVRGLIQEYVGVAKDDTRSVAAEFRRLVEESRHQILASPGLDRGWTRDSIYEERLGRWSASRG